MPLDERFKPPAPVVPFTVESDAGVSEGRGLIDTGSSHSIVPRSLLEGVEEDGFIVLNLAEGSQILPGYPVSLVLFDVAVTAYVAGASWAQLAGILPAPADDLAILGRDVLNETHFDFNGPAGEISSRPVHDPQSPPL